MVIKIKESVVYECIEELIKKAVIEIPKMPDFTNSIERLYVAEKFDIDGIDHIFSFYCTPPYEYQGDGLKKTMLGCELYIPSIGVAFSNPLMYEFKNIVIKSLDQKEIKKKIFKKFLFLFKNFEDYNPED